MGQRLIEKVFYPEDKPSKVMGVVYVVEVVRLQGNDPCLYWVVMETKTN